MPLSLDKLENGNYLIGVHIADVSLTSRKAPRWTTEAYDRGTSVYLVDRVVPMLPEILSNNVCSLASGRREAHLLGRLEGPGSSREKRVSAVRSSCSNRRFTYEEAQAVIEGADDPLREEILILDSLAKKMRERRMASRSHRIRPGRSKIHPRCRQ